MRLRSAASEGGSMTIGDRLLDQDEGGEGVRRILQAREQENPGPAHARVMLIY